MTQPKAAQAVMDLRPSAARLAVQRDIHALHRSLRLWGYSRCMSPQAVVRVRNLFYAP